MSRTVSRPLDVICLGRAAVDLYAQQVGARLEDAQSFAKYLGGSSANLAVGLARLGLRVSMLTRVGDEHMGRFVRATLEREGVDVGHVHTDPRRLTGLVLLGIENAESFPHIFYRENCADMGLELADVSEAHIASSRALAVTGTHLSQPGPRAAMHEAIACARRNGTRVVLDIDYRPVLWGLVGHAEGAERFRAAEAVTREMQAVLADCDLVVGTEEEIRIAGGGETLAQALAAIRARTQAAIVMKRGAAGCTVFTGTTAQSGGLHVGGSRVAVLNLLGAGDAFLSGFLSGWLSEQSWERCAALGNAAGAMVVTRHGCTPAMPTRAELEHFMAREPAPPVPDRDPRIVQLHRATHVRREPRELCVLAFDHRRQLEQAAFAAGAPLERLRRLKEIIAEAVIAVGQRNGSRTGHRLGVIVDDRYGAQALARLGRDDWWVGRPVEIPASRPLEFEAGDNPGLALLAWPRHHVVKCLLIYRPSDPIELRLEQERRVRQLHEATTLLERELLVEVICTAPGRPADAHAAANTLRRFYNLGIRPAWWKLEAQSAATWQEIATVIEEQDPLCQGVVLLGLDASEAALAESFAAAAPFDVCRGFAVGRTIFGNPARDWLAGASDDETREKVIAAYARVIELWRSVRSQPRRQRA